MKEQLLSFAGRDLAHQMKVQGALSKEELWHLGYLYSIVDSDQPQTREFLNVYDLALYGIVRGFERPDAGWIFRGQRDAQWDLLPGFYRARPHLLRAESDAVTDLVGRQLKCLIEEQRPFRPTNAWQPEVRAVWLREREYKLQVLRASPAASLLDSLSEYQQDAVIQHYQLDTPFLDFSRSICVAAFFATLQPRIAHTPFPQRGAIFVISPTDLEENLGSGKVLTIELPEDFERPRRQKAVFVLTAWPELFREGELFDVWTFLHTRIGEDFECPSLGVTRTLLLADRMSLDSTNASPLPSGAP